MWKRGRERDKNRERKRKGEQEEREGETEINLSQELGYRTERGGHASLKSAGQAVRNGNPVRLEPSRHRVQM